MRLRNLFGLLLNRALTFDDYQGLQLDCWLFFWLLCRHVVPLSQFLNFSLKFEFVFLLLIKLLILCLCLVEVDFAAIPIN